MGHLLTVAKMRSQGQETRNTFWWGGNDATHTNAQAIIDEIADAYRDELEPALHSSWELYAFDVYDKTVPSAPGIEYLPAGAAIVGDETGDTAPNQIAVRIDFKASVPAPNTNRKYIGGWAAGAFNATGGFDAGVLTTVEDFGDRILALPTATSLAVVLEVVELSGADGTVVAGNPLTYRRVNSVPSALRRRKIGVGI